MTERLEDKVGRKNCIVAYTIGLQTSINININIIRTMESVRENQLDEEEQLDKYRKNMQRYSLSYYAKTCSLGEVRNENRSN